MRAPLLALPVLAFLAACSTSGTGRCRIDVSNLPPAGGAALVLNMYSEGTDNPLQVVITNGGTQDCFFESLTQRIGTIAPGTTSLLTFTASASGLAFTQIGLSAPLTVPATFSSVGSYSPTAQTVHPHWMSTSLNEAYYAMTVCGLSTQYKITVDPAQLVPLVFVRELPPPQGGRNTVAVVSQAFGDVQRIDFVDYGPKVKRIEFGEPGNVATVGLPNAKLVRLELEPQAGGTMTARILGTPILVPVVATGKFDATRGAFVFIALGDPGHASLIASYRGLFTEIDIVTLP